MNDRERDRIDSPVFDGKFTQGIQGNTLIFKDLVDPVLVIDTDRFGPINAMSLIYCRPGDFDGDGIVDVTDLKKLNEAFKAGSNELTFDVNFDLTVDFKDVLSWIKCSKGTCIGDVNLDGVFDSSDLIELFQERCLRARRARRLDAGRLERRLQVRQLRFVGRVPGRLLSVRGALCQVGAACPRRARMPG